jgi:hypothetical protein
MTRSARLELSMATMAISAAASGCARRVSSLETSLRAVLWNRKAETVPGTRSPGYWLSGMRPFGEGSMHPQYEKNPLPA